MHVAEPGPSGRRFEAWIIAPLACLLAAALLIIAIFAWLAGTRQEQLQRAGEGRIVASNLGHLLQVTAATTRDYAWWNSAVRHLVIDFDKEWASRNIGGLQKVLGYDASFVVAGDGHTIFAQLGARSTNDDARSVLGASLERLITQAQAPSAGEPIPAAAFLDGPGGVFAVAASALLPRDPARLAPPPGRPGLLVVGKRIDARLLAGIGQELDIQDLHLAAAAGADEASIVLPGPAGETAPQLVWASRQGGSRALAWLAAALLTSLLIFALYTYVVLRSMKRASAVQKTSEARFRSLVENMRDIIFCRGVAGSGGDGYDAQGVQLYGADVERFAGTLDGEGRARISDWHAVIHDDDRPAYLALKERRRHHREPYAIEYRIIHPATGELRWMREVAWVAEEPGSSRVSLDSYILDITEQVAAKAAATAAAERSAMALLAGRMGTWEWDATTDKVVWDQAQCRIFGLAGTQATIDINTFYAFIHPEDLPIVMGATEQAAERGQAFEGEYRIVRPDGSVRWLAEHGVGTLDAQGQLVHAVGVNYDITDRKEAEQRIRDLALRDALTGLPNRRTLQELLARDLAAAARDGQVPALMLVDLDNFKAVNDTLGHSSGDALLVEAARRLQAAVRAGDCVARLGGDEFAVLTTPSADPGGLGALAKRLVSELGRPFTIGEAEVQLGGSVGVAVHTGGSGGVEGLLAQADLALYAAKGDGRGTWRIFQPVMQERARQGVALDRDLRAALENGEFRLFFQPIIGLEELDLRGFEALVRWQSPERGLVGPGEFLAAVERGRLMTPLSFWIMAEALAQAASWRREGLGAAARVAVNVPGSALADGEQLVEHATVRLRAEGLKPEALLIEITEDAIAGGGGSIVAVLESFRQAEIKVAIDDFGSGHSSLARLRQLPLDLVKIDRAFLTGGGVKEEAILRAIVELAQSLDLATVAEGVETVEQLSLLRRVGAGAGQGYLLARPMPAGEVAAWSRAWSESRLHDRGLDLLRRAGLSG